MPEAGSWVAALRGSHDRLVALTEGLTPEQLTGRSYASEWTVAQVLSHLGSQAELFSLLVDAGLTGATPPGRETMLPIWDRWNALSPEAMARESVAANALLVDRLEKPDPAQAESFRVAFFGRDLDIVGLVRMRLSEHAVHTWDVAVALDPGATVAGDAVALLVDHLPETAARVGKPLQRPVTLAVSTRHPERRFALVADGVRLEPWADQATGGSLALTAEALFRLVYGRLDPAHTPPLQLSSPLVTLDDLRTAFPGF
jgi:uncharacterized protein (TIGR03083 family)